MHRLHGVGRNRVIDGQSKPTNGLGGRPLAGGNGMKYGLSVIGL